MAEAEDHENKDIEARKRAFAKWLQHPLTNFTLVVVQNTADKDALNMLIEAAFASGWTAGSGNMLGSLVTHVAAAQSRKNPSAGDGKPNGPAGPEAQSETVKRGDQPRM